MQNGMILTDSILMVYDLDRCWSSMLMRSTTMMKKRIVIPRSKKGRQHWQKMQLTEIQIPCFYKLYNPYYPEYILLTSTFIDWINLTHVNTYVNMLWLNEHENQHWEMMEAVTSFQSLQWHAQLSMLQCQWTHEGRLPNQVPEAGSPRSECIIFMVRGTSVLQYVGKYAQSFQVILISAYQ